MKAIETMNGPSPCDRSGQSRGPLGDVTPEGGCRRASRGRWHPLDCPIPLLGPLGQRFGAVPSPASGRGDRGAPEAQ